MEFTIKEALTFGGLQGAVVIAGRDRLDNIIKSISVLEVAEEKISAWVLKDQLYITSFYAIKEDAEQQKHVIHALYDSGCCGLVICHIKLWIKEMDPSVIALCDALHFPLIVAKSESSYIEILNPIICRLTDNIRSPESYYSNIRNDFLDLIINEEDSYSVFRRISEKISEKITFFDIYCNCIFSNKLPADTREEVAFIKENFNSINEKSGKNSYVLQNTLEVQKFYFSIHSKKSFFGYMVVDYPLHSPIAPVLETAETLKTSCALLFSRKNKVMDMKEYYLQEYITDLLVWNFRSDEIAIRKGLEVDINIYGKNVMMTVNINAFQQGISAEKSQSLIDYIKKNILPYIKEVVYFYNRENIVIYRSDVIIILLEDQKYTLDLRKIGEKILTLFEFSNTTVSIGISNHFEYINQIPEAYERSFQSAILGRNYYGENHITTYPEVWFLHQIRGMRKDPAALLMSQRFLEPLTQYDAEQNTNLTDTLYQLIHSNQEISELSQKLFVHRNTLLYRKNKIIEILGYSPFEMPHIINFIMAFEISNLH